jgi:hypothetical protein
MQLKLTPANVMGLLAAALSMGLSNTGGTDCTSS